MPYDAIIIGAGMSGLAAGIRLAQFDRRVAVLERHTVWGGLNSFYKRGGYSLDSGLHALTNYVPPDRRGTPLPRVLRQLRIRREELRLREQGHSEILFPGLRLRFTNDFSCFEEEVVRAFPSERDGFAALVRELREYDLANPASPQLGARERLGVHLRDPLAIEALLLPILYYGSPREEDLDWHSFAVLFQSIFLEGLCRPEGGIRPLLRLIVDRYRSVGGELRMDCGVRRILTDRGAVRGVELDDGSVVETSLVISSAGYVETMRLCADETVTARVTPSDVGRLSFVETISIIERAPAEHGHEACTSFFSRTERPRYRVPDELVDVDTGVISVPGNFKNETPLPHHQIRLTVLADHDRWSALEPSDYQREKERLADHAIESAARLTFDWRPGTVFRDVFTPCTIRRFTGRLNGAVYGSPNKRFDGETGIEGLCICGTDQGYLGVIGAMISGITMANRHALVPA